MENLKDQEETSALEALQKAKMDWTVSKEPAYLANGTLIPDTFAVVRSDTGQPLNRTVGKVYRVLQNRSIASIMDRSFGSAVKEIRAGMFNNGARIFIQAKLDGGLSIGSGDYIDKYVLLTSTHDATAAFQAFVTPIRVSCKNALMLAVRIATADADNSHLQTVRHTSGMAIRVGRLQENLALVNREFEVFQEAARGMLKIPMSLNGLTDYVRRVGLIPAKGEISGKSKSILEEVSALFEGGRGQNLPGVRGSLWGGLQAAIEYLQYFRATRGQDKEENRLESATFGTGAALKRQAWAKALELIK